MQSRIEEHRHDGGTARSLPLVVFAALGLSTITWKQAGPATTGAEIAICVLAVLATLAVTVAASYRSQRRLPQAEQRRRSLLPRWIRACSWLLLCVAAITPVLALLCLWTAYDGPTEILGLKAPQTLSPYGLFLLSIYVLLGVVAYGLLWGRRWAVMLRLCCGFGGALTTIGVFAHSLAKAEIVLPSYLVLQVPFVLSLLKVRERWEGASDTSSSADSSAERNTG